MTLAKALKKRNRIIKRMNDIQGDILKYNSLPKDAEDEVDIDFLIKELAEKTDELINLKVKMFEASRPIRDNIFRLAELKSKMSFFRQIDTTRGWVKPMRTFGGNETQIEYKAAITKTALDEMKKTTENNIDILQDEMDKFNYTTEIVEKK